MTEVFGRIENSMTLSQKVVQKIEDAILEKKFVPGDKLPTEKELCEMFGVSRTVVREALQILSAKGFVDIKKGSGVYVKKYDTEHLTKALQLFFFFFFEEKHGLHLVRVRQIIEPHNARLAAENRTEEQLERLLSIVNEMKQGLEYYKESELDRQFHILIAEATNNPIIPLIMHPVFELMPKVKTSVLERVGNAMSSAIEFHEKIVRNIEQQDSEGSFQAMTEHLIHAEEHIRQMVESLD